MKHWQKILGVLKFRGGERKFIRDSVIAGAALAILVLYLGLFVFHNYYLETFFIIAFFVPGVLNYFYLLYRFEKRKKAIEEEVPDILLLASSLPKNSGVLRLIDFMILNSDGPLKEEFGIVKREIESGVPVEKALFEMGERNESVSLKRTLGLLVDSLNSGAEMSRVFRETAEDFMETNSIIRDRVSSMMVEKYTILVAGGIIVPFILGLLTGLVNGLEFSAISEIGIGMAEEKKQELIRSAFLGSNIYIFEYALLASVFVAFQENSQKKAILYALFLVPMSIAVFTVARGM